MLDNIIEKNIEFLQRHGVRAETENDKGIYRYGLQILYSYIINIAAILAVAALFGRLHETAIMLFVFAVFQVFGGGYHAKTKLKCSSLMVTGSIAGNVMAGIMQDHKIFMAISAVVLAIMIISAKPVTNIRHPVSKTTYKRSKVISQIAALLSLLTVALTLSIEKNIEAAIIVSTLYLYAISMLAAKAKGNKANQKT